MLPEQSKCNTFEHRLILVILYNISYVTLHVLSSQKTSYYNVFVCHEYTISIKWLDNPIHKTQLIWTMTIYKSFS